MNISFDIPDDTTAIVTTVIIDDFVRYTIATKTIGTADLKEGATFKINTKKDLKEEA